MDFKYIQDSVSKKWVVSAPRRASRPNVNEKETDVCPFCPGHEKEEQEVYRIGGEVGDSNWIVRVLPNKFPFAPIHEIIIHSQDHHKNFGELDTVQVELIFKAFRQRYQNNSKYGQVYIFHNRGHLGGESLSHPHSQLVVVPKEVNLEIAPLPQNISENIQTNHFLVFCPESSQWPDEVWIAPKSKIKKQRGKQELSFGNISDEEISDLASSLNRLVQILSVRHGNEFPFNFYISSGEDWYLRITPRSKILGGFEIGTGIFVNTQDPKETLEFIKEHFVPPQRDPAMGGKNPKIEKIHPRYIASYKKAA